MSEPKLNLKFIHLASNTAATNNTANAGAIIFEPKSGRIAVQGTSELEYYGGNIKNATFVGKVLTLSFNKGEDIRLDFNDVASAEGMTTLLSGLRDEIDTLRTDVTALQGDSHTHDNKTVLGGITDVKVAAWDAVAGAKSTYDDHVGDTNIHVTAKQKTAWDGKQAALSTEQLAAANSGITATKVSTYDDHVGDTNIHVTTEDKAKWNAAEQNAKDYADGLAENYDAKGAAAKALADAKAYTDTAADALGDRVDTLVTTVDKHGTKISTLIGSDANKSVRTIASEELAAQLIPENAKESLNTLMEIAAWIQSHPDDASGMNDKIAALETTVGDEGSGLVKQVADNTTNIGANATAITALQNAQSSGLLTWFDWQN